MEREGKWRERGNGERGEMEKVRGNGERMRKSQTQYTAFVASVAKILTYAF